MGLGAVVSKLNSEPLGSAEEVLGALCQHFVGAEFVRYKNVPIDRDALRALAESALPEGYKLELVGPEAPFAYQVDYQANSWSYQATFDDGAVVLRIFLTFYFGDPRQPAQGPSPDEMFAPLLRQRGWELNYEE